MFFHFARVFFNFCENIYFSLKFINCYAPQLCLAFKAHSNLIRLFYNILYHMSRKRALMLHCFYEYYSVNHHCTEGANTVCKEQGCHRAAKQVPYYRCPQGTNTKATDKAHNHCAVRSFQCAKAEG